MTVWPMETVSAGDMTAPSEGRRTRLGEVIYGAMFEVQIDLRYGGAEKAEYIADAVRRALEEAEPGDPASLTAASCAESLRRLLTPPDAQEPAQEPRTGAGGPGVPTEGCEAVSGQQWGVVEAPQDGGE